MKPKRKQVDRRSKRSTKKRRSSESKTETEESFLNAWKKAKIEDTLPSFTLQTNESGRRTQRVVIKFKNFSFESLEPNTRTFLSKTASLIDLLFKLYYHVTQLKLRFIEKEACQCNLNDLLRASRSGAWFQKNSIHIGKALGSGQFGTVFLMNTKKGKRYALKLEIKHDFDISDLRAIQSEKNSMILCRGHSNILQIKATALVYTISKKTMVMTLMEFADFGTLKEYFEKLRPNIFPLVMRFLSRPAKRQPAPHLVQQVIQVVSKFRDDKDSIEIVHRGYRYIISRFCKELLSAIEFLYRKGIAHEDLHSTNILIGKGFHLKISDFGISRIAHPLYEADRYNFGAGFHDNLAARLNEKFSLDELKEFSGVSKDRHWCENLLCEMVTGFPAGPFFFKKYQHAVEKDIAVPAFKHILFYDRFLLDCCTMLENVIACDNAGNWAKRILKTDAFCNVQHRNVSFRENDLEAYIHFLYEGRQIGPGLESVSPFKTLETSDHHIKLLAGNMKFPMKQFFPLPEFLDDSVVQTP